MPVTTYQLVSVAIPNSSWEQYSSSSSIQPTDSWASTLSQHFFSIILPSFFLMENTFLRCLEKKFKKSVVNFSKYLKIKFFNIDFWKKKNVNFFKKWSKSAQTKYIMIKNTLLQCRPTRTVHPTFSKCNPNLHS